MRMSKEQLLILFPDKISDSQVSTLKASIDAVLPKKLEKTEGSCFFYSDDCLNVLISTDGNAIRIRELSEKNNQLYYTIIQEFFSTIKSFAKSDQLMNIKYTSDFDDAIDFLTHIVSSSSPISKFTPVDRGISFTFFGKYVEDSEYYMVDIDAPTKRIKILDIISLNRISLNLLKKKIDVFRKIVSLYKVTSREKK